MEGDLRDALEHVGLDPDEDWSGIQDAIVDFCSDSNVSSLDNDAAIVVRKLAEHAELHEWFEQEPRIFAIIEHLHTCDTPSRRVDAAIAAVALLEHKCYPAPGPSIRKVVEAILRDKDTAAARALLERVAPLIGTEGFDPEGTVTSAWASALNDPAATLRGAAVDLLESILDRCLRTVSKTTDAALGEIMPNVGNCVAITTARDGTAAQDMLRRLAFTINEATWSRLPVKADAETGVHGQAFVDDVAARFVRVCLFLGAKNPAHATKILPKLARFVHQHRQHMGTFYSRLIALKGQGMAVDAIFEDTTIQTSAARLTLSDGATRGLLGAGEKLWAFINKVRHMDSGMSHGFVKAALTHSAAPKGKGKTPTKKVGQTGLLVANTSVPKTAYPEIIRLVRRLYVPLEVTQVVAAVWPAISTTLPKLDDDEVEWLGQAIVGCLRELQQVRTFLQYAAGDVIVKARPHSRHRAALILSLLDQRPKGFSLPSVVPDGAGIDSCRDALIDMATVPSDLTADPHDIYWTMERARRAAALLDQAGMAKEDIKASPVVQQIIDITSSGAQRLGRPGDDVETQLAAARAAVAVTALSCTSACLVEHFSPVLMHILVHSKPTEKMLEASHAPTDDDDDNLFDGPVCMAAPITLAHMAVVDMMACVVHKTAETATASESMRRHFQGVLAVVFRVFSRAAMSQGFTYNKNETMPSILTGRMATHGALVLMAMTAATTAICTRGRALTELLAHESIDITATLVQLIQVGLMAKQAAIRARLLDGIVSLAQQTPSSLLMALLVFYANDPDRAIKQRAMALLSGLAAISYKQTRRPTGDRQSTVDTDRRMVLIRADYVVYWLALLLVHYLDTIETEDGLGTEAERRDTLARIADHAARSLMADKVAMETRQLGYSAAGMTMGVLRMIRTYAAAVVTTTDEVTKKKTRTPDIHTTRRLLAVCDALLKAIMDHTRRSKVWGNADELNKHTVKKLLLSGWYAKIPRDAAWKEFDREVSFLPAGFEEKLTALDAEANKNRTPKRLTPRPKAAADRGKRKTPDRKDKRASTKKDKRPTPNRTPQPRKKLDMDTVVTPRRPPSTRVSRVMYFGGEDDESSSDGGFD